MSLFESTGLAIVAYDPEISSGSYDPRGYMVDNLLAYKCVSYEHEILANGGWWTASLQLRGDLGEMEEWFANGLNRHVEVFNPGQQKVWEGFVNAIEFSAGTLSVTRGPLMDIANRLSVVYTPILDPTADPPIKGTTMPTTIADDADSQTKYGIIEKVLSGGDMLDDGTTDEAEQFRDSVLEEMKEPETSESLNFADTSEPSVTLRLLGYAHRFGTYVFQDLTTATIQLDTKIQGVISGDPNGLFSTDYTEFDANAYLTSRYENTNRTAWDIITSLVKIGDASDDRYTFGVYGDRVSWYKEVPEEIAYMHRITDPELRLETYSTRSRVDPWDVLPARWIFVPDFLIGQTEYDDMRRDQRHIFIESVRFVAPYTLSISGNKVDRLNQILAKRGA